MIVIHAAAPVKTGVVQAGVVQDCALGETPAPRPI